MSILSIDSKTVRQICVSQVITTVAGALKELIENAMDAGATEITIKTVGWGAEEITVEDNGRGIREESFENLVAQHATSKISNYSDVEKGLGTFGFRGEALSALCGLSDLKIVTRHSSSESASQLSFSHSNLTSFTPCSMRGNHGTIVTAKELFKTIPVRRKELIRNAKKEYQTAIKVVQEYCVCGTGIRIKMLNQQVAKKGMQVICASSGKSLIETINEMFGIEIANTLQHVSVLIPSSSVRISGFVSKVSRGSGRSRSDIRFMFANARPIDVHSLSTKINHAYKKFNPKEKPIYFLNLQGPSELFDVNVTPDKRTIFMKGIEDTIQYIHDAFIQLWELPPPTESFGKLRQVTWQTEGDEIIINPIQQTEPTPVNTAESFLSLKSGGSHLSTPQESKKCFESEAPDSTVKELTFLSQSDHVDVDDAPPKRHHSVSEDKDEAHLKSRQLISDCDSDKPPKSNQSDAVPEKRRHQITSASDSDSSNEVAPVKRRQLIEDEDSDHSAPTKRIKEVKRQVVDDSSSESIPIKRKIEITEDSDSDCEPPKKRTQPDETHEVSDDDPPPKRPTEVVKAVPFYPQPERSETTELIKTKKKTKQKQKQKEVEPEDEETKRPLSIRRGTNYCDEINNSNKVTEDEEGSGFIELDDLCSKKLKTNHDITMSSINVSNIKKAVDMKNKQRESHDTSLADHKQNWTSYTDKAHIAEEQLSSRITKSDFRDMRIVGQFNKGFIVTRLGKELFLVDQHASDEKYNFEKLKATYKIAPQPLVQPRPLSIPVGDILLLKDNEEIFKENGFRFQFSDDDCGCSVSVIAVPTSYNTTFTDHDIQEIIAILKEIPGARSIRPTRTTAMLASRACRKSVMIGTTLNNQQMSRIIKHMSSMNNPWNCPHGRPTLRHLATITLKGIPGTAYSLSSHQTQLIETTTPTCECCEEHPKEEIWI